MLYLACWKVKSPLKWSNLENSFDLPILRNHTYVSLFIALLYFHTAPIFSRWPFTRLVSSATSSIISGNGAS